MKLKAAPPTPMPDVAGLIRTLGSLLKDVKEGRRCVQQLQQIVSDGPSLVTGALRNHQPDDALTQYTRVASACAVLSQLQTLQSERVSRLQTLLPELETGVQQLRVAMERMAAAPRRSYYDTEPDTSMHDAERANRVQYLLQEAVPLAREAKFWLSKLAPDTSQSS